MGKTRKLLYLVSGAMVLVIAVGLIFTYEKHIEYLEEAVKVELIWRFLGNFGL